jgi:hypothetical protein
LKVLARTGDTILDCEIQIALSETEFRCIALAVARLVVDFSISVGREVQVERMRELSVELSAVRLRETVQ